MPRRRLASRVLLISDSRRLLLFKIRFDSGALAGTSYWATPGGKLRDNESYEAAAIREVYEETGIEVQSVGDCVARKEFSWLMPDGEQVIAVEHYYVVHVRDEQCSSMGWSDRELEAVCEVRWWSACELAACREKIFPEDLLNLFAQVQ
ncbi:NUDIX hydrolase [Ectopseudomonas khazarica]|uniref:NUDIX hydrolase n=1 Tax=Ectopseudomonas khazarica TaxID=2502979 RepID=UPI002FE41DDD